MSARVLGSVRTGGGGASAANESMRGGRGDCGAEPLDDSDCVLSSDACDVLGDIATDSEPALYPSDCAPSLLSVELAEPRRRGHDGM